MNFLFLGNDINREQKTEYIVSTMNWNLSVKKIVNIDGSGGNSMIATYWLWQRKCGGGVNTLEGVNGNARGGGGIGCGGDVAIFDVLAMAIH